MYQTNMIGVLLAATLLLTSCTSIEPNVPKVDFRNGIEGAVLSIDGPSDLVIYSDEAGATSTYDFKVNNKGAYTIKSNEIILNIGLKDTFLKTENDQSGLIKLTGISAFNMAGGLDELAGKSMYTKIGDEIIHSVGLKATPPPSQGVTASIEAELCYRYQTILTQTVCIDTSKQRNKCKTKEYSYSNGQGAPVRISKLIIREKITDDTTIIPMIVVTIDNPKKEIITPPEKFADACGSKENLNNLTIKAWAGNTELSCDAANGMVTLKEEAKVICALQEAKETPENFYDTPITVQLDYGYHQKVDMGVNIKRENIG